MERYSDEPTGKSEDWQKDLNFAGFSLLVGKLLRKAYDTMPAELRDNIVPGNARPTPSVVYMGDKNLPSYASYVTAKPISDYIISKLNDMKEREAGHDL